LSVACAIGPFRRFIATWRLGYFQKDWAGDFDAVGECGEE